MGDEREPREDTDDEVKLPEEPIEDLEPDQETEADVKGGGWPIKWGPE